MLADCLGLPEVPAPTELLGAARVRALLAKHGVRPSRALGQNFVIDPNTIRKTLAIADLGSNERVLEIGPGAGSLTVALAGAADSVVAVEYDERLVGLLQEVLQSHANVEIVHEDAKELDFSTAAATTLVANLPYNIAASMVLKTLEQAPSIRTLTVMTQKEAGERLAASSGSKAYGIASVLVAYYGAATVAGTVSRRAFWPVPRVDSVVVRVERGEEPQNVERETFYLVVKAAFSQRRKTLRNSLAKLAGTVAAAEALLGRAGIDGGRRAETLEVDDYIALAKQVS